MKRVIALGFFDGVHLGHGALLQKARQEADRLGCTAAALTFDRHPAEVIFGRKTPLINTLDEREQIMKNQYHMDEVLVLPFDDAMMRMPWDQFVSKVLQQRFQAQAVVCGHDFTFGHAGQGTPEKLKEVFGENCHVIEPVIIDGITVSSTAIRTLLQQGKPEQAAALLGHDHFLTGTVVHGKQLGRTLGIPTANLLLPESVIAPTYGVYAAKVNGIAAVTNVGIRPTVDDGEAITVESWLLDHEEDLYGKTICVELAAFIRPEQKFSSVEELKNQILRDAQKVKALLK